MSNPAQQWLHELGQVSLPATKAACKKIQQLLHSPSANYAQFTDVIKHDPGFSLAVLRGINSANNRKKRVSIIDIGRAIPLLGVAWLAETVTTLPRINNQYSERQRKGVTRCYSHAIHASYYAFYFATQQQNPHANEVAILALLNNMGEAALWASPSPAAQQMRALAEKGASINEAIASSFDLTKNELTKALRQQWNLSELDPLLYQPDHTNIERKICIDLAYEISLASEQGWQSDSILKALQLAAEYLNLSPDRLISEIHSLTAEIAHRIEPLGLPCSAFNLSFIPQKIEYTETISTRTPQSMLQPDTAALPASANTKTPAPATIEIKDQTITKPVNAVQQLISRQMHEIQKQDGLSRVVFIMLTHNRKQLVAQVTFDNGTNSKIAQFRTIIGKHDLFGLLLRKPQTIWMNPEKLVEYARLVPHKTYNLLESEHFFAMSLFSKTRPIGLIYADNGVDSTQLDKATYLNFKRLCQRISNELKQ